MARVAYRPSEKAAVVIDYINELASDDVQNSNQPVWVAVNRISKRHKVTLATVLLWVITSRDDKHSAVARAVRNARKGGLKICEALQTETQSADENEDQL